MITREWFLIVAAALLACVVIYMTIDLIEMLDPVAVSGNVSMGSWLRLLASYLLPFFMLWVTLSHLSLLRRFKKLQGSIA